MYDVATLDPQLLEVFTFAGGDYEWAEFRAWKAPTGGFYWYGDSGCSCSQYGDRVTSLADFGNGDRDALERAWRAWMDDTGYPGKSPQQVIDGVEIIRRLW